MADDECFDGAPDAALRGFDLGEVDRTVNERDERLNEFLEVAWVWGDAKRARVLLDAKPDLVVDSFYAACAALDKAAVAESLENQPKLAKRAGGPRQWQPVLYAAWSCFHDERPDDGARVIELLLDAGADPGSTWRNKEYEVEESALYGTVEGNNIAAARVLLEAGADPNDGESLYHSCEKGDLAWLDLLAEFGLNEKDVSYCIKHAMDFRWAEGVQWFLDQGADPNAVHKTARETSLHWAVKRNCSLDTLRALLEAGADPNAKTSRGMSAFLGIRGRTPLDTALRLGRTDAARLLEEASAIPSPQSELDDFVIACAGGDRAKATDLLEKNPRLVEELDMNDRRLVAHVAQMEAWDGVRLMLDLGWPLDASGWMNAMPLTWALCFGNPSMVDDLLGRGAPLAPAGDYFREPLHTALHCRWGSAPLEDRVASIERLLLQEEVDTSSVEPTGIAQLDALLGSS